MFFCANCCSAVPTFVFLVTSSISLLGEIALGETLTKLQDHREVYRSLKSFSTALFHVTNTYIDPVDSSIRVSKAISGLFSNLDPHSIYLPKQAFQQLTRDTRGNFGGIGVVVTVKGDQIFVVSPIDGTPAKKAGLEPGDKIVAINDKVLETIPVEKAMDLMQGDPGSKISLTIKRSGVRKLIRYELIREIIRIKSVASLVLPQKVIYSRITSFQESTFRELSDILKNQKDKMAGLILDLRDNPGGLLHVSVQVADMFIPSGVIVSTIGRDRDQVEREFAHVRDSLLGFPIIVLLNHGSASASEIVAGALQDHGRAIVVGMQSYGKGTVQTLVSLPNGDGIKLTVAQFYTPNGNMIQGNGVSPNIEVAKSGQIDGKDQHKRPHGSSSKPDPNFLQLAKRHQVKSYSHQLPEEVKKDEQLKFAYEHLLYLIRPGNWAPKTNSSSNIPAI